MNSSVWTIAVFLGAILGIVLLVPKAMCDPRDITNVIDKVLDDIEAAITHVAQRIVALVKSISRPVALALLAVGITLWATGINSGRGKQLILGAVILLAAAEMI